MNYITMLLLFFQLDRKKKEGTYKTKKQKEQEARAEAAKAAMLAAGLEGESVTEWARRGRHPPAIVFLLFYHEETGVLGVCASCACRRVKVLVVTRVQRLKRC